MAFNSVVEIEDLQKFGAYTNRFGISPVIYDKIEARDIMA
jgi:hypothetical protein